MSRGVFVKTMPILNERVSDFFLWGHAYLNATQYISICLVADKGNNVLQRDEGILIRIILVWSKKPKAGRPSPSSWYHLAVILSSSSSICLILASS